MEKRSTFYLNEHTFIRDVALDKSGHFPARQEFDFAMTIKYDDYEHYPNMTDMINNTAFDINVKLLYFNRTETLEVKEKKKQGITLITPECKTYLCIITLDTPIVDF